MNFDGIIGQKEVIGSLTGAIKDNRVGHAYVFSGMPGIGRRTAARVFSALLLCEKGNTLKTCGECLACHTMSTGANPDFHVIEHVNGSIGVDDIRNLQKDVIIKPLYSNKKVYMIVDADKMTIQAQNCLLKTLEEPPGYIVIILIVSNIDALLETIRSRTIRYNFKKNTRTEVYGILHKKLGEDFKGIDFIVTYADGVIGTALELANSGEFVSLRDRAIDITMKISSSGLVDIFDAYDFFEDNKESIDTILDTMLLFYRDLFMVKKSGSEKILINSDKKDIILSNVQRLSVERLVKAIDAIEEARRNIRQNANYQLTVEVMLMKLQEEVF